MITEINGMRGAEELRLTAVRYFSIYKTACREERSVSCPRHIICTSLSIGATVSNGPSTSN